MFLRSVFALLLAGSAVQAGEKGADEGAAKAKEAVEKHLAGIKASDAATVRSVDEKYLRTMFPKHSFVAVHYPLWPVARVPADPLKSQNIFAVSGDGKVTHLADEKKLEEFFKTTLGGQLDQDKTVKSYLRLRMEYVQDGYYKFKFPEKTEVTGPGSSLTLVEGVAEVVPEAGNKGNFKVTIKFDRADKFAAVQKEENNVVRGMRPRCQATLLLHPEKLVREIAEQDLLVMGRLAEGYLKEQRAKASDELRREIDRVWRQIEAEGR